MIRLLGTILLTLTVFCSTATAQDAPTVDQFPQDDVSTVVGLLSGYHELGALAAFDAVPNAPKIVEAIARGPHSIIRDRALGALGQYWPSADVYLLYANVVASDATADGTRHRVVMMFAEAFGDRAIPALRPLLTSGDLQLQITTVQALGRTGSEEAYSVLAEFAKTATDPVLVEELDRSTRLLR